LIPISNLGVRQDLIICQGADYLTSWTFLNPNGSPMDLTGCLHAADLRKYPGGPVVASFTLTPTLNVVSGLLPASVTTGISCGPNLVDELSRYQWDYKFTDSTPYVWRLFYGDAKVFRLITP
jgi:hypothetical protein